MGEPATPAVFVERAGFRLTEIGLEPKRALHFEEWETLGEWLGQVGRGIQWVLGDWLAYAEGRPDWGERYSQAVNVTGYAYQTIANYRWVAIRFPVARRRIELSWSHHHIVAGIDDRARQDAWLAQAIKEEMSVEKLRLAIGQYENGRRTVSTRGGGSSRSSTTSATAPKPELSALERLKADYLALPKGDRLAFINWLEEYHGEAGEVTLGQVGG